MKKNLNSENIRIVVKNKAHGSGHHGGAWKVAYADFVTTMMALFLVLWIVGASSQVKGAVSMYFSNPAFFKGGSGIMKNSNESKSNPDPTPIPEIIQSNLIKFQMAKLEEQSKKIEETIESNPDLSKIKDKINISVDEGGMKIELIENSEGLFFSVGSAEVKPETVLLLKMIASQISNLPNKIIIEGHTDTRAYETSAYSNWELSSDRANAARKLLEENGVSNSQIMEIRGLADRFLRNKDNPLDASNRRVSILLVIPKNDKEEKPVENIADKTP